MPFKFLDVRVGQIGVEASTAAIAGKAQGPYAAIGNLLGYEQLFGEAQAQSGVAMLPWPIQAPRESKFWKKYITGRLPDEDPEAWAGAAWQVLVPLKVPVPLPNVRLHESLRRSFSEAFVWPTGFGFVWNNWIEDVLDPAALILLLDRLKNGEIEMAAADGTIGKIAGKDVLGAMLKALRPAAWGAAEGVRSGPITVVTIARAVAASEKEVEEGLAALIGGIMKSWTEKPVCLDADPDLRFGNTIYASKTLRIVWLPNAFLRQGRTHTSSCLHRNLLMSALQVEMLASAAQALDQTRAPGEPLPPLYGAFAKRVIERSEFFLGGKGYSAPFLSAQLERSAPTAAREALA